MTMYSEQPKCYSIKNPKARKEHRCCECRGIISAGEKYHVFSGVWDFAATYKTCEDCEALRSAIIADTKETEDYPAFGELYEHIFEGDPKWVSIFMYIRRKRRAPESPRGWMERRELEILASLDQGNH